MIEKFIFLFYALGIIAGLCGIVASIFEEDLSGLFKDITGINVSKYSNGIVLTVSLILVPIWPVLLLKPIFNWLKRPCQ